MIIDDFEFHITKINNTYTCLVKTKKDEAYDIIIEEIKGE